MGAAWDRTARFWARQVAVWAKTLLGLVDVGSHENDQLVLEFLRLHHFETRVHGGTDGSEKGSRKEEGKDLRLPEPWGTPSVV